VHLKAGFATAAVVLACFQHPDNRVLAHSLFGCAIYGAFAAKVTILRLHRFPRFVLPVAGGLPFATLIRRSLTAQA